jgi:TPR repeat protein
VPTLGGALPCADGVTGGNDGGVGEANGDRDAQFRVAYRFAFCRKPEKRDWAKALAYWRLAAEQGHVRAQFYLGTCFDFGRGARVNRRNVVSMLERSPARRLE